MQGKFKRNSAGISEMLRSKRVQDVLLGHAQAVGEYAESLSDSGEARYRVKCGIVGDRARALVGTTDVVSCRSNAKHNSLSKAIRSAHGKH